MEMKKLISFSTTQNNIILLELSIVYCENNKKAEMKRVLCFYYTVYNWFKI